MERRRIQRKQAFLRFEIEALQELPRKLGWVDWLWLLGELLLAVMIVRSCNGWTSSNAHFHIIHMASARASSSVTSGW